MQRLFIALYPPEEIAEAMTGLVAPLALPRHRLTPVQQVHCTALFLGDRPAGATGAIIDTLEHACRGIRPFELTPLRVIRLPRRNKARTVVMETDRPSQLLELHERLVQRLLVRPRSDARERFLPHLTIARFAPPGAECGIDERVELPPFRVDRVYLVRSVLRPEGAEHRPLESISLGTAGT